MIDLAGSAQDQMESITRAQRLGKIRPVPGDQMG